MFPSTVSQVGDSARTMSLKVALARGMVMGEGKMSCTSACMLKEQVKRASKRGGEIFTSYC